MATYTADICDIATDTVRVLEPIFQNYGNRRMFEGEVVTVRTFEDNALLNKTLDADGTGKVLVVDNGGSLRRAVVGGNVAAKAAANGWAGIIINGCARDLHEISETDVGVQALAITPMRPRMDGFGETGVPVHFAGVRIEPGDYLYADEDGIVVLDSPAKL